MGTSRFMGVTTSAVLSLLRLLWRLRLLIVVVLLMVLLMQHMYCRRNTSPLPSKPPGECPNCTTPCVPYPCVGSASSGAGLTDDR
jgi:hypothetical protein